MFRFTIRDVLWLTVVVAVALGLGLGWWGDRRDSLAKMKHPIVMGVELDGKEVAQLRVGEVLEVRHDPEGTTSFGVFPVYLSNSGKKPD